MNSVQARDLAVKYHQAGNLREAARLYNEILQVQPGNADVLHLLGLIAYQVGKHEQAIDTIRLALGIRPNFSEAQFNLGTVLMAYGKLDEAVVCYRQAVNLRPDYAEAYVNLGAALRSQGKLDEAAASLQQALRLKPDNAVAHCGLGSVLAMQGKPVEAAASFEHALQLQPNYAEAHNNLGVVLQKLDKLDAAAASIEQGLRLKPDNFEAHCNLGNVFRMQGKLTEAAAGFEYALRLQPNYVEAHIGRAQMWLSQGNFEKGWPEHEWRWRLPANRPRPFPQPLWKGEPLAGRTILLHAEQGLGDTLQLFRYAALVRARGAGGVLLECQPGLVRLLSSGMGADRVLAQGEPLPHFDLHAPLFSLPLLLSTTSLERIPAGVPYLYCDAELVQRWRTLLNNKGGGKRMVGIVWQGNASHQNDRGRSVSLERFARLSEIPGVSLISLQKGVGSEQLPGWIGRGSPLDLGAELTDFADTAAVLQNLDLVVTVDTSVAHLAGALGVPAWVVLPFAPDWRWLLERQDSPWYPSLRLFRQIRPGDWADVFRRVQVALGELTSSTRSSDRGL